MESISLTSCALCGETEAIRKSHIIPKFIYRYFKDTSTGRLRRIDNPNITHQDGQKENMLCGNCEGKVNKFETIFANALFYPYKKEGIKQFTYDKWLSYFITSVSWRILYLDIIGFVREGLIGLEAINNLTKSEKIMREYLLGNRDSLDYIENHIFFIEDLDSVPEEIVKLQPHVSIHRSIGGYTVVNVRENTYFTMTNLMGIFLITFYNQGEYESWEGTKITNGIGTIEARDQHVTSIFGQEITAMIKAIDITKGQLSENQSEAIINRLRKAGEKIMDYEVFEEKKKDLKLEKR